MGNRAHEGGEAIGAAQNASVNDHGIDIARLRQRLSKSGELPVAEAVRLLFSLANLKAEPTGALSSKS